MHLLAAVGQRVALLARPALTIGKVTDGFDERSLLVGKGHAHAGLLGSGVVGILPTSGEVGCQVDMQIRRAEPLRDAAACAAIYEPYVRTTAISFEEHPPDAHQLAERIERFQRSHQWLVAEENDQLVGFAYGCPHRERAAYRWAADVS